MKNYNAIGNEPGGTGGATGWEGVEAKAGQMEPEGDKFTAKVEDRVAELAKQETAKTTELSDLRDKLESLAKPSGVYYGEGTEVKEVTHDTSKTEAAVQGASRELNNIRSEIASLSTPEGREAAAEKLRTEAKEAADRQAYYETGLRSPMVMARLQELDAGIASANNPTAREAFEKAKKDYIENTVIPLGKGILENQGKPTNEEAANETMDDSNDETLSGPAEEEKANLSFKEKTEEFERGLMEKMREAPQGTYAAPARLELVRAGNLMRKLDEFDPANMSRADQKDRNRIIEELSRYGRSENGQYVSSEYEELENINTSSLGGQEMRLESFGKNRRRDYEMLGWFSKNGGKDVKKALKKAGFKKLPEKWDDDSFTTYEISKMRQTAELAALKTAEANE